VPSAPDARRADAGLADADVRDAAVPDSGTDAWIDAAFAPPLPAQPDSGPSISCAPGIDAGPPQDAASPAVKLAGCCDDGDAGLVLPERLLGAGDSIIAMGSPDQNGDSATWWVNTPPLAFLGSKVRHDHDGSTGAWTDLNGHLGWLVDDGDPASSSLYDELGLVDTKVVHVAHGIFEGKVWQRLDGSLWADGTRLDLAADSFDDVDSENWPVWMTNWNGESGTLFFQPFFLTDPPILLSSKADRYQASRFVSWWENWDATDPLPNGTLSATIGVDSIRLAQHALGQLALQPDPYAIPMPIGFWTVEHLADGEHLIACRVDEVNIDGAWDLGIVQPVDVRVDGVTITFEIDDGGEYELFSWTRGAAPIRVARSSSVLEWVVAGDRVAIRYSSGQLVTVPIGGGAEIVVASSAMAGSLVDVPTSAGDYLAYVTTDGALHLASSPCAGTNISTSISGNAVAANGWILWKSSDDVLLERDPIRGVTVEIAPSVRDWHVDLMAGLDAVEFDGTSQGVGLYRIALPYLL
jgi:hypothetical protein